MVHHDCGFNQKWIWEFKIISRREKVVLQAIFCLRKLLLIWAETFPETVWDFSKDSLTFLHMVRLSQPVHDEAVPLWNIKVKSMADTKPTGNTLFVSREPRTTRQPRSSQVTWQFCSVCRAFPWVRTLLHGDYRGVVDGLHDGGQAAAQVVGLADVDFGRVFEDHCVCRAVQNSGQELTQLHL